MDQPLPAHSWSEVHLYLMVTPCGACGKGPWRAEPAGKAADAPRPNSPTPVDAVAVCANCGATVTFRFSCPPEQPPPESSAPPVVNPADQPSAIIDVGQWLGLFHEFLQSAANESDKATSRRIGYEAAQCLSEALKFYGDDEMLPPSALFTERSREAFRDHPEKFVRQRLRDMQGKLPSLTRMAERLSQDRRRSAASAPRRPWWRFWWRKS